MGPVEILALDGMEGQSGPTLADAGEVVYDDDEEEQQ